MMYTYSLQIAETNIQIHSPSALSLPEYFLPFTVDEMHDFTVDAQLEIFSGTDKIRPGKNGQILAENVFLMDGKIHQRYRWQKNQYIIRIEPVGRDHPCRLGIPADFFDKFCENANWLLYLALERLLMAHDYIILHSSAVIWNEKAYLFCARSGGGKSTQAALWERNGAVVLNGDKVVIGKNHDGWTAYGSPIAGSSGIYRNLSAPIAAIMMLQKDSSNQLELLSKRSAFLEMYSNAVKSDWDKAFNVKLLDILDKITNQIPVYQLKCTPDSESVKYVLGILKG